MDSRERFERDYGKKIAVGLSLIGFTYGAAFTTLSFLSDKIDYTLIGASADLGTLSCLAYLAINRGEENYDIHGEMEEEEED